MWSCSSRCHFQGLKGYLDFCCHQFPTLNQEVLIGHIHDGFDKLMPAMYVKDIRYIHGRVRNTAIFRQPIFCYSSARIISVDHDNGQ